jgi:drug/metabolite transporter (DMT)-like permease
MWLLYALLSAIIWGANYLFYEKILSRISVSTLYFIDLTVGAIVFFLFASLSGTFIKDLTAIQSSKSLIWLILATVITSILANLFIALAIQSKNATLSTLVEISYPIFIILLAWILFRENNLTPSVLLGGGLIFSGIAIIYAFNK